ncbi:hypothetical protein VTN31DRAFT_2233 [Thermomyces dupontii]|uniref:uncharacterized protein n=1 Tax=Talaromyces thermophilus TaxID=28565 RepID=UPI003743F553
MDIGSLYWRGTLPCPTGGLGLVKGNHPFIHPSGLLAPLHEDHQGRNFTNVLYMAWIHYSTFFPQRPRRYRDCERKTYCSLCGFNWNGNSASARWTNRSQKMRDLPTHRRTRLSGQSWIQSLQFTVRDRTRSSGMKRPSCIGCTAVGSVASLRRGVIVPGLEGAVLGDQNYILVQVCNFFHFFVAE